MRNACFSLGRRRAPFSRNSRFCNTHTTLFLATFTRARRPRSSRIRSAACTAPFVSEAWIERGQQNSALPLRNVSKNGLPELDSIIFFFSYEDDDFFEGLIKSSPLLEILISNSFIFYWNFSSSRYPLNYFCYRWQFSLFFFPRICPFFESLEYRSKFEKSKRLASNEREGNSMQIFTFVHTLAIYRLEEDFSLCLSSFSEKKPRIICVSNGNIETHFPDITFYPSSNYTYTSLLFHPILRRR